LAALFALRIPNVRNLRVIIAPDSAPRLASAVTVSHDVTPFPLLGGQFRLGRSEVTSATYRIALHVSIVAIVAGRIETAPARIAGALALTIFAKHIC
jgi:hypothetical protein